MTLPQKKILIADDDLAICESLQLMLQEDNYVVSTTQDGGMLSRLGKDMPDLILLDVWMSGHDGSHICRELKLREATKHIPVILMSARRDIAEIATAALADDYLAKPFSMRDLLAKVEHSLTRHEHTKNI